MIDEFRSPATIPRGIAPGTGPGPAQQAPSALIQSLKWMREWAMERLDSLETLARQQSTASPASREGEGPEGNFERKLADLEEAERRFRAQVQRQEEEWRASLTQLEADRRLLAEAWERVERERVEHSAASEPHAYRRTQGQGTKAVHPASIPHAGSLAVARADASDPHANEPITQSILRQFQALCSDVRRNAEERRDPL